MIPPTSSWWTWFAVAALGTFHGLNPAMGWLFAVALGLYRRSRRVVLLSLVPIALGHALAAGSMLMAGLSLGMVIDHTVLNRVCGTLLIGWAAWHAWRGHRMRPLVGMQTGFAGLTLWSFVMAGSHGAGLMLIPALMPICSALSNATGVAAASAGSTATVAAIALCVHSAAMLLTTGVIALAVYDHFGVAGLRTKWLNFDLLWTGTLATCGVIQLAL
ncbi:hypothetical protein [Paraburkholderia phenazinium]|jgi:hypothetical protein|uniref:Uncharacterized protein n=1 Tax=Paraburkholderia phenazinium TaxID=60549 RepID=A0A1N6IPT7_9BURK|nr:hypothetical protein [Paraburkholderia phenazinium]SIO34038.1 hypothetical protein SAMN05444165_2362 [Paraburkholderia phenazinium]